ncbi:hypothetical protein BLNAU_2014 [Blattamonas nauphoetae]|uniref:Uncharacterized protein n=1 Tax=Blattamonas nauphoetae TaxID=2049346 RepID=A0ABQ9YH50_9EUKA|nr:hypothetical protein BLNAU_2014 [Blattamonas nauphoetae]
MDASSTAWEAEVAQLGSASSSIVLSHNPSISIPFELLHIISSHLPTLFPHIPFFETERIIFGMGLCFVMGASGTVGIIMPNGDVSVFNVYEWMKLNECGESTARPRWYVPIIPEEAVNEENRMIKECFEVMVFLTEIVMDSSEEMVGKDDEAPRPLHSENSNELSSTQRIKLTKTIHALPSRFSCYASSLVAPQSPNGHINPGSDRVPSHHPHYLDDLGDKIGSYMMLFTESDMRKVREYSYALEKGDDKVNKTRQNEDGKEAVTRPSLARQARAQHRPSLPLQDLVVLSFHVFFSFCQLIETETRQLWETVMTIRTRFDDVVEILCKAGRQASHHMGEAKSLADELDTVIGAMIVNLNCTNCLQLMNDLPFLLLLSFTHSLDPFSFHRSISSAISLSIPSPMHF